MGNCGSLTICFEDGFDSSRPAKFEAPAGTKRISNRMHAADWAADDLNALRWPPASARGHARAAAGEAVLAVWDGRVWEQPERQAGTDWCPVRSANARRRARRGTGRPVPRTGAPILVPGRHWDGVAVVGMAGATGVGVAAASAGPSL